MKNNIKENAYGKVCFGCGSEHKCHTTCTHDSCAKFILACVKELVNHLGFKQSTHINEDGTVSSHSKFVLTDIYYDDLVIFISEFAHVNKVVIDLYPDVPTSEDSIWKTITLEKGILEIETAVYLSYKDMLYDVIEVAILDWLYDNVYPVLEENIHSLCLYAQEYATMLWHWHNTGELTDKYNKADVESAYVNYITSKEVK